MKVKSSSTHKKVVVETFGGTRLLGYVNPRTFDRETGLEMLNAAGQREQVSWKEVKIAWFVQNWEQLPPRPQRMVFLRRPRLEGLWIRLRFRDQEVFEGLVANDLLNLSPHGYLISPPDLNGYHQRAFVPRTALSTLEVLAVIPHRGQHHRRRPAAEAPERAAGAQAELFRE